MKRLETEMEDELQIHPFYYKNSVSALKELQHHPAYSRLE
jgi:hypothetical protein